MSRQAVDDPIFSKNGKGTTKLEMPELAPGEPLASLIEAALVRGVSRIRAFDPAVRQGDIDGMHRMRASTRRLRSELRLFEDQIDPEWALSLETDLKWVAS